MELVEEKEEVPMVRFNPNKITFEKMWEVGIPTPAMRMHQPFTVAGVTDSSFYEHKGFKMVWTPHGVFGIFKGKRFTVPLANVIVAEF
jgi:hypothetical protein